MLTSDSETYEIISTQTRVAHDFTACYAEMHNLHKSAHAVQNLGRTVHRKKFIKTTRLNSDLNSEVEMASVQLIHAIEVAPGAAGEEAQNSLTKNSSLLTNIKMSTLKF